VFTEVDPREDGFTGEMIEGVSFEQSEDIFHWPDGHRDPEPCVGQEPTNDKRYKVFKYPRDLQKAGFHLVSATFGTYERWSDYTRIAQSTTNASARGDGSN